MLRSGDVLGERYQIIEQIAAGGMGALWRAHHVELDVDVALKVVSVRATTPTALRRFKREARAAAKLRSPNVVQVLDYGEFDGQPYLAMELLRGEDLARRIVRRGKIPPLECATILDGIAKGVQIAHDAGIVHRDLKPGNVFLETMGEDEVVKILDFGIAKELEAVPDPGSTTAVGAMGSPAYMSPEQVWAKSVGRASDVWSMGVVAFEMLTGTNPFLDETLAKIFERIIREPIPKVSQLEPDLPAELDVFFARALARAPTERIASAKELAAQFRAALERRVPSRAPDVNALAPTEPALDGQRETPMLRRRNGIGIRRGALMALAVVLVALVVIVFLARQQAKEDAKTARPVETHSEPSVERGDPPPLVQRARPLPNSEPSAEVESTPPVASAAPSALENARRAPKKPRTATPSASTAKPAALDPTFGIPLDR